MDKMELKEFEQLLKELAEKQKAISEAQAAMKEGLVTAHAEMKATGQVSEETKTRVAQAFTVVDEFKTQIAEMSKRLDGFEATLNRPGFGTKPEPVKGVGDLFVESVEYKAMNEGKGTNCRPVEIKRSAFRLNTKESSPIGVMTTDDTAGGGGLIPIQTVTTPFLLPMRPALLRQLFPARAATSDQVNYPRETGFAPLFTKTTSVTNLGANTCVVVNVGGFYVGQKFTIRGEEKTVVSITVSTKTIEFTPVMVAEAPTDSDVTANDFKPTAETKLKPQTRIRVEQKTAYVKTIATTIPVSNQLLRDAVGLSVFLNQKLPYAVMLSEEAQMLYGNPVSDAEQLPGIFNDPDVQSWKWSDGTVGDTQFDAIRRGIEKAELANYPVDFILVNPHDAATLDMLKDAEERYLSNAVMDVLPNGQVTVWRKPVYVTNAMLQGNVLIGASRGLEIADREAVQVRIYDQHEDFAAKNLSLVKAESALAILLGRPEAFVIVELDSAPSGS